MGIMNFVKSGVREMMIARPDNLKHLVVYKHPDQNFPFWSQLTVDSDECALFFKDGKYVGHLNPGRHTLSTQNIPFLNNIINKFTGGDVFISEIYFVKMTPIRGVPFGGPLEQMEDPILFEPFTPRIFGEFALVVVDPIRFVIGYHGQAAGPQDNDTILNWIKGKFFMAVKMTITEICQREQKSFLNLGGMTMALTQSISTKAPNLEEIGVRILEIGNFNINFSAEEMKLLREANKQRAEARRGVGIAGDKAAAKQFELDQKFNQDAKYVQNLAGNWQNYAAGSAVMGAGEGMAKGGGNSGVAALGAQMAVGMGMGAAMNPAALGQQPQFVPPHMQAPGGGGAPVAKTTCPKCAASVPLGKFCAECGGTLAAPTKKFCANCGTETGAAKFCANCGTPVVQGPPSGG